MFILFIFSPKYGVLQVVAQESNRLDTFSELPTILEHLVQTYILIQGPNDEGCAPVRLEGEQRVRGEHGTGKRTQAYDSPFKDFLRKTTKKACFLHIAPSRLSLYAPAGTLPHRRIRVNSHKGFPEKTQHVPLISVN